MAHAAEIAVELGGTAERASRFLERLLRGVSEVEVGPDDPEAETARRLIGGRDPTDIPFVALALRTEALGIWTLDNDFEGIAGVRRLTTRDVAALFEANP